MTRRLFLACLVLAVLPASASASAPVQTLTVINQAGISAGTLARYERAVTFQADKQLRPAWHTSDIRFGPGGWQVILQRYNKQGLGWHWVSPAPYALVTTVYSGGAWSITFSHEILEMLVNPLILNHRGKMMLEVCDPVEEAPAYSVLGVKVADFVTPRWFDRHAHGRMDQTGDVTRSGEYDGLAPPPYV